ncbi:MAG: polymerase subunit delta [Actinomycetota bacterium]
MSADLYAAVVGQNRAVEQLRAASRSPVHAYLLVGPGGTGKLAAARAFAASLLCPNGGDGTCDVCRRVLNGVHPDVMVLERQGASILVDDAREIARLASRSPTEGDRKVVVLTEFHLVDKAGPALLKTIEEPPPSTVFVILAEHVPQELVTIASRCCRIDFGPIPTDRLAEVLVAEGADPASAATAAAAASGRLDRARLLVSDPGFVDRRAAWRAAADKLDGTGATAARLATELLELVDGVIEPVRARQAAEQAALEERAKQYGERGIGRRDVETRQKREQRRVRMDELRSGLAVLAGAYRDRLAAGTPGAPEWMAGVTAVRKANEALEYNPNETLLLQALLVRLPRAPAILDAQPG